MPTCTLRVPADFDLARDVCSYGYFLLAPNHWNPRTRVFSRVLATRDGAHSKPVIVAIRQLRKAALRVTFSRAVTREDKQILVAQITRMLRLDESAERIAAFHARDPRSEPSGRGRLFRSPTLFEDVIKTVTSCNVQWPGTIQMNQRLCEVIGSKAAVARGKRVARDAANAADVYAFPTPKQLARARVTTLRARCRVGYRDQRIIDLASLFLRSPRQGGIDQAWFEDPQTPDDAVCAALVKLPGIGPYAAANIMQLLGRYSRLPLDTESVRHGRTILGFKGSPAQVMKRLHKHYESFGPDAFRSYWFELWDFYESKRGPASTWDRESTGKTFTAALL
jgi:3-methyladenine DNA glycosylase/8-oxoguanine DNA glycosylase